ncbi:hypothetical protein BZA70DRAFT_278067 [Myxozyma melibiosi]|uniref:Secreted protein n=1 Tax=Myxozyma melibiosi TaxID=54550 RepID=A0ABR1F6E2_9ASCO
MIIFYLILYFFFFFISTSSPSLLSFSISPLHCHHRHLFTRPNPTPSDPLHQLVPGPLNTAETQPQKPDPTRACRSGLCSASALLLLQGVCCCCCCRVQDRDCFNLYRSG